MKKTTRILLGLALVCMSLALVGPGQSFGQQKDEAPLPSSAPIIDVSAPEKALYRIAVPDLQGSAGLGEQSAGVLRNDFSLVSLFKVLDPASFVADAKTEGLGITPASWQSVGAQGVIKGNVSQVGSNVAVTMQFFELARGTEPTLKRNYNGNVSELRSYMHAFANEVVKLLTGEAGVFGTRLVFARRQGPGRKDVFVSDFDGANLARASNGRGVSMLPTFGPGGVWYSVLTPDGMFITRAGTNDKPVIKGAGLHMGVSACGNRLVFSSTRDGNSEIYSANSDGSDMRRLTNDPGIDVSPSCSPSGQIAFVSNRHGSPQIWTMDSNGGGQKRITYKGEYNQTPAWCPDPKKQLIAFTGRDTSMDVFTINLATGEYTRVTQAQGTNKDPAFSPDCRMIAFASSRGGIYVSNPQGLNQIRVVSGAAETVRWSR
ncbi:MAG: tolB protein precursor [Myxococcaceae bacterium]|nr:tolB protein precursor [Myxococcaceae bacterium]